MKMSATAHGTSRVLIVEDNDDTRWLLSRACQTAKYSVGEASSGREALRALERNPFDVMILDLQLPDMHGIDVLRTVATDHPDLITIILTANPTQASAISAVRGGAADYLSKPTAIKEFLEVIATKLAQRAQRYKRLLELGALGEELIEERQVVSSAQGKDGASESPIKVSRFRLNRARREVKIMGEETCYVELTDSETAVLAVFMDNTGEVLSNQELAFEAWADRLDGSHAANIIRPIIFRLRQKLEEDPSVPRFIRTVRGAGYVFDPS